MNVRLCLITSVAAMLLMSAMTAGADQPWKPQASIPGREHPGKRPPPLDEKQRRRFDTLFKKGQRLLQQGQYPAARKVLQQATELDPNHPQVRLARARVLLVLGYLGWRRDWIEQARIDVRHAAFLDPDIKGLDHLASLLDNLLSRMRLASVSSHSSPPPQSGGRTDRDASRP
jgi:Tfp pilus assembly protein PilF